MNSWKKRLYNLYRNNYKRCNDPTFLDYKRVGAKGIKFLFKSFEEFAECYYEEYSQFKIVHRLVRIDPNGHFEKDNLEWVPLKKYNTKFYKD